MHPLDLSTADDKILADIKRYMADVQNICRKPVEAIEGGIKLLTDLRGKTYENLNQIQHEYAALCAVRWLIARNEFPDGVVWHWNPRQTGGFHEPDIQAILGNTALVSGEVTTSSRPIGTIDRHMAQTLGKLAKMEGHKFYFVRTEQMKARALTKVGKAGYDIRVELLPLPQIAAGQID